MQLPDFRDIPFGIALDAASGVLVAHVVVAGQRTVPVIGWQRLAAETGYALVAGGVGVLEGGGETEAQRLFRLPEQRG